MLEDLADPRRFEGEINQILIVIKNVQGGVMSGATFFLLFFRFTFAPSPRIPATPASTTNPFSPSRNEGAFATLLDLRASRRKSARNEPERSE